MAKDEWVSISEAAIALGISERTVSRRIKKGELLTRKEGRTTLVNIDSSLLFSDKDNPLSATVSHLQEMIEHMKDEIAYLRNAHAASLHLLESKNERRKTWWKLWGDD